MATDNAEEFPKSVIERSKQFDNQILRERSRFFAFLLGPGFPKSAQDFRVAVKEVLEEHGYNGIIMREEPFKASKRSKNPLYDKFWYIVRKYDIQLFICIFPGDGQTHAVIQEVAYIEERCKSKTAAKLLRFCFSDEFSIIANIPQYTKNLVDGANTLSFCEGNPACLAWSIERVIDNEIREIAERKKQYSDCLKKK
ncbi:MAG: hypothetical protein ACFFFC_16265 [Candidatus Thorarchaeota archaeon]